jgi:hypothetical protein
MGTNGIPPGNPFPGALVFVSWVVVVMIVSLLG